MPLRPGRSGLRAGTGRAARPWIVLAVLVALAASGAPRAGAAVVGRGGAAVVGPSAQPSSPRGRRRSSSSVRRACWSARWCRSGSWRTTRPTSACTRRCCASTIVRSPSSASAPRRRCPVPAALTGLSAVETPNRKVLAGWSCAGPGCARDTPERFAGHPVGDGRRHGPTARAHRAPHRRRAARAPVGRAARPPFAPRWARRGWWRPRGPRAATEHAGRAACEPQSDGFPPMSTATGT